MIKSRLVEVGRLSIIHFSFPAQSFFVNWTFILKAGQEVVVSAAAGCTVAVTASRRAVKLTGVFLDPLIPKRAEASRAVSDPTEPG